MPLRSLQRSWRKNAWMRRLSGLTFEPSTAGSSLPDFWAWQLEVSPVSHIPWPATAGAPRTSDGSSTTSCASSTKQGSLFSSSRTSEDSSAPASTPSFKPSMTAGSMRSGVCSKRPPVEPRTAETDCSSWPTTTAGDAKASGSRSLPGSKANSGTSLTDAIRVWPTPVASLVNDGESISSWSERRERNKAKGINGNGQGMPLTIASRLAPSTTGRASQKDSGRRLNPAFSTWLMGLPWWWNRPELTRYALLATALYRHRLRSHLNSLLGGCGRE